MEVGELLERVKSVPRWARWLAILTWGVATSVGVNYYVIHSKEGLIEEKEQSIAKLERELRSLKRVEREYETVRQNVQYLRQAVLKSLSELEQKTKTIETLKALMLNPSVKVDVVEKVEKKEERAGTKRGEKNEKSGEVNLSWAITKERAVAEGRYKAIESWVKAVESTGVSIDDVKLKRKDGIKGTVTAELIFSYKTLVGANELKKKLALIKLGKNDGKRSRGGVKHGGVKK